MLRIYARVLSQLGSQRGLAILLVIANLGLAGAHFAEPILFGRIIDSLAHEQRQLVPLIAAWVGFGFFTIGAGVVVALYADRLAHRRRLAVMAQFFEHVLSLPQGFAHSGRLIKVMLGGADAMSWLWLGFFREHCAALVTLFVLLPMTLFLSWQLGALLLFLVTIFAGLTVLVTRKTQDLQSGVTEQHAALAEHTADALGNLAVIQSFTRVEAELSRLRSISERLLAAQLPVLSWWALAAMITRASATLTVTAIVVLGAWLHSHGKAGVGDIVTFMSLSGMLVSRLEATVGFVSALFLESTKIAEWFSVVDSVPTVRDAKDARDAGTLRGEVAFEHVCFSYPGSERAAVNDVSFHVKAGETIALVGTTGSGKSTTLSLLHRVFDPQAGCVRIDGHDVRELTLESLRRNIGVVFQEPLLFARSLRENVMVGNPEASEEELMIALRRAQASQIVQRMGLDADIGERGRTLSGGERQRLSIARALLKNPPILVLDEATSALDNETERALKLALDEVMIGRTTFIIAHRLSTIRSATRIFVFADGRVVESGTYDALATAGGRFAAML